MEVNLEIEWTPKTWFAASIQRCGIHEFPHRENILANTVIRIRAFESGSAFFGLLDPDPHFLGSWIRIHICENRSNTDPTALKIAFSSLFS